MHFKRLFPTLLLMLKASWALQAQQMSFTYQGRLDARGMPANGPHDFIFQAFDASSDGNPVGTSASTNHLAVSNGLFTVALDFGPGVFTGPARWLEIAVRVSGSRDFVTLSPRQALTPVPYALHAGRAATVTGSIAGSQITGTIPSGSLAPGAAAQNLSASGALVLSATETNNSLAEAGFVKIGKIGEDDLWRERPSSSALSGRIYHSAVWTGSEMIVWGGRYNGNPGFFKDGGRFNPALNTWTPVSTVGAPAERQSHSAIWTGNEMIIWGGFGVGTQPGVSVYHATGGRYNPVANTWTPTSFADAPTGRVGHTAVWTGSEMLIWGGFSNNGSLIHYNTGARYNPAADVWTQTEPLFAPTQRAYHSAVWTGSEMIVFGGTANVNMDRRLNSGGRYNPVVDTWTALNTNGAPSTVNHTTIWTGREMIVWGGSSVDGARYNPAANSWSAVSNQGAPSARQSHTAVWTGSEMIVWGGHNGTIVNDGGRYNPTANTWKATGTPGAPGRQVHTAVWTGSEMLIYGGAGTSASYLNDVWSYKPGNVAFLYQKP